MRPITSIADWPAASRFAGAGGARPSLPGLRIDGRVFRDGDRLWVPRLVSHLTALAPARSERDWEAYFAWAVATGFTGTRVFAGALTWTTPPQTAADARARLPRYLDLAAAAGLVVEVSAITDSGTGYDTDAHVEAIAEIVRPRKGHVLLELSNEVGHGSQAQHVTPGYLRQLGARVAPDLLWAIGSTGDEPEHGQYPGAGGRYATGHLDRGRDLLNQVRRVRELYAIVELTDRPVLDNERLGADELDGSQTGKQRTNEPWFFFTAGVLDRCYPGIGGVHHSQAGLMAEIPGPMQQLCAEAEIDGHAIVAEILGDAIPHYANAGHAGAPILNPGGSEAFEDRGHEGGAPGPIIRAPSFVVGDRALTVVLHRPDQFPHDVLQFGNGWRPEPPSTPYDHVTLIESRR